MCASPSLGALWELWWLSGLGRLRSVWVAQCLVRVHSRPGLMLPCRCHYMTLEGGVEYVLAGLHAAVHVSGLGRLRVPRAPRRSCVYSSWDAT